MRVESATEEFITDGVNMFDICAKNEIGIMDYCELKSIEYNLTSLIKFEECVERTTRTTLRNHTACAEDVDISPLCLPFETRNFCRAFGMIRNGIYYYQLKSWLDEFGDNLKIVSSEEFYSNTAAVMDEITEFLGLVPFNWSSIVKNAYNVVNLNSVTASRTNASNTSGFGLTIGSLVAGSSSNPTIPDDIRNVYTKFYSHYNERLAEILNRKFWE